MTEVTSVPSTANILPTAGAPSSDPTAGEGFATLLADVPAPCAGGAADGSGKAVPVGSEVPVTNVSSAVEEISTLDAARLLALVAAQAAEAGSSEGDLKQPGAGEELNTGGKSKRSKKSEVDPALAALLAVASSPITQPAGAQAETVPEGENARTVSAAAISAALANQSSLRSQQPRKTGKDQPTSNPDAPQPSVQPGEMQDPAAAINSELKIKSAAAADEDSAAASGEDAPGDEAPLTARIVLDEIKARTIKSDRNSVDPEPAVSDRPLEPARLLPAASQSTLAATNPRSEWLRAAVPVALAATATQQDGKPSGLADLTRLMGDVTISINGDVTLTPTPDLRAPATPQGTAIGAAPIAEALFDRQLDLASGGEWIDQLARDIATAADSNSVLRFRLNPEHLGRVAVELKPEQAGTHVKLTVDSDQARTIIADAQPRLVAEARSQGLQISGSQVDLASHNSSQHPRQNQQPSEPIVRTARFLQEQDGDPQRGDGKPSRSGSERYA